MLIRCLTVYLDRKIACKRVSFLSKIVLLDCVIIVFESDPNKGCVSSQNLAERIFAILNSKNS